MITKIQSLASNKRVIEICFTLMLLSFPFGSFFLSFSIGFMTLYPYLMILFFLALLSWFMPRIRLKGLTAFYAFFVLFFFLYATAFLPFVDGKSDAIIDLRSITLMLITTWVFIVLKQFFGFDKWCEIILFSFKLIFGVVVLFAVLEMASGWHIAGEFTEKISARGLKDHLSYVPVFLWDNPNNFMAYLILISGVIILLEPAGEKKDLIVLVVLLIPFVLSVLTEARIGQLALLLAALVYFTNRFWRWPKARNRSTVFYVLFVIGAATYAVATNSVFTEIAPSRAKVISAIKPKFPLPYSGYNVEKNLLKPVELDTATSVPAVKSTAVSRNSKTERLALIHNGLDFVIESYFLGVGPGQYRYRHDQNQIQHYAFGNNGAHFWLIELVSQYGVIVLCLYLIALFWVAWLALKQWSKHADLSVGLCIGLGLLAFASVLPSAFLILDINWIFTVILIQTGHELYLQNQKRLNDSKG